MSLLDPEATERPGGRRRRGPLLALIGLAAAAALAYVAAPRFFAPDAEPVVENEPAADPAPPTVAPAPDPVEPPPAAPADPPPPPAPAPVEREAAPPPVRLRVTADVPGADVFIDRRFAGTTPFESRDVEAGPHQITVNATGFDTHAVDVEIAADAAEPATVDVEFQRVVLDERIPVIHKHRFGDCEGTLVASLDGIRYDTDDDDAFFVRFDDLDQFEVDYLDHNLQLSVAGGRTYNFTDRTDNADALFVFRRTVNETRERLARSGVAAEP